MVMKPQLPRTTHKKQYPVLTLLSQDLSLSLFSAWFDLGRTWVITARQPKKGPAKKSGQKRARKRPSQKYWPKKSPKKAHLKKVAHTLINRHAPNM